MPQVPYSPVPDVAPSTHTPDDYFTQQANPNDFGAQVGQATEGLGQSIDKASGTAAQQVLARQGIYNENTASQAQIDLDQQYTKNYSQYSQLRGQDAVNGLAAYNQQNSDARTAAIQGMPNLEAQNMLAKGSVFLLQRSMMMATQHRDQEQQQFFISNQNAIIENAIQQAAFYSNSPNQVAAYAIQAADAATQGSQHAIGGGSDDDATAARATTLGRLYRNTIGTLAQTNPGAAMTMFNGIKDQIDGPSQLAIGGFLKQKVDTAGDNAYVSGLLAHAGVGGGTSGVADAIMGQEASGPTAVSSKGAAGKMQVTPAFFQTYKQGGESFDNETDRVNVARRGIDALSQLPNVNGDPARIAVGYFSGPGNIAPPGSATPWIEDKSDGTTSTSAYVAGVLAHLNGRGAAPAAAPGGGIIPSANAAPSPRSTALAAPSYPDESAIIQKTIADNPDPEVQARRLSRVTQALGTLRLATETDRRDLMNSLPDLQASALGGNDITIPDDRIHRLLPPAQAAQELEQLNVAKQAGQVLKGIQWGTPDQVNAAHDDLFRGVGPISAMIHNHGVPVDAQTTLETPDLPGSEQYRLRMQILQKFDTMMKQRTEDLKNDPAGYVAANPVVAAKAAAVDPKNPATFEDYANASLATQESLGVAPSDRHVLSATQAAASTKQLMSADPATTDVGAQLDGIAKGYGKSWPQAFGDLVTLGKLPREYQILGSMDAPGQAAARIDFNRALQATAKRGGSAQMEADAPPGEMTNIKRGLDATLDQFRQTASVPGISGNIGLVTNVRESVKQLATFYAIQGMAGNDALQKAADGILNQKYDFGTSGSLGTSARVPKGTLATVESAANGLVSGLKPEDLMPFRSVDRDSSRLLANGPNHGVGDGGIDKLRQADALRLVQRNAQWAPTEDDQGLFAYVKLNDGRNVPVKMANGERLEMRFDHLPQGAAPPPPVPFEQQ